MTKDSKTDQSKTTIPPRNKPQPAYTQFSGSFRGGGDKGGASGGAQRSGAPSSAPRRSGPRGG